MANTLTAIMPKILARGLLSLRGRCVMPRMVNGDYSIEAAKKGATIDVPVPTAVATRAVVPAVVPPALVDIVTGNVQVSLNNWRQNDPIHLEDKELCEIDAKAHFLPMQLTEAINSLARDVNQSIYAEYLSGDIGIYGAVGTAGTTPFAPAPGAAVTSATNARRILNRQMCPRDDRRGVLDYDAEANALALPEFSDAEKVMSARVKTEGEIGRKYGIDWVADDDVPLHTAGTIDNGAVPNTRTCAVNLLAGYPAGTRNINVDKGAAAQLVGTIVVGDIISFANHAQTYCVVANAASAEFALGAYTAAANAITGLRLYPALTTLVPDNTVITVAASHRINLAFHRDAFAFATRPLVDNSMDLQLGSQIMSMQDPLTGLVLRLEVSRQHKQVAWEFDILWGAKLVRPELAVRIMG